MHPNQTAAIINDRLEGYRPEWIARSRNLSLDAVFSALNGVKQSVPSSSSLGLRELARRLMRDAEAIPYEDIRKRAVRVVVGNFLDVYPEWEEFA